MLRTSLDQPGPTDPAVTRYGDDELRRMREETASLITTAMKQAAAQLVALTQPPENEERGALLAHIQQDLAALRTRFAARDPQDAREDARFVCDALKLFRVCARAHCRKAQACRGDPEDCHARARVPQPANEWAVRLLVAEHTPWLPLLAETPTAERAAYECWIAGIEAGRTHRPVSARPRESGDPVRGPGFPLARE